MIDLETFDFKTISEFCILAILIFRHGRDIK